MSQVLVRDRLGRTIGWTNEISGNQILGFSTKYGGTVGIYDKASDRTHRAKGGFFGQGNQLIALIYEHNSNC